MLIPFLFELRTLIDWTFTPTSLSFSEWMRVETIYFQVFQIKCMRVFCKKAKRGVKKPWTKKLLMGGGLALLIIGIIWFPLVLFAYSPSLGQSGVPKNVAFFVEIENYQAIYKIDVRTEQMIRFNRNDWNKLKQIYEKYPQGKSFLEEFDENDVVLLQMNTDSLSNWNISPPNLKNIIECLSKNKSLTIRTTFEINELGYLKDKEAIKIFDYKIKSADEKQLLVSILQGHSNRSLTLPSLLPKFLQVSSTGKVDVVGKFFTESFRKFF